MGGKSPIEDGNASKQTLLSSTVYMSVGVYIEQSRLMGGLVPWSAWSFLYASVFGGDYSMYYYP